MSDLDYSLVLRAVDKFSRPAKKIAGVSKEMAKNLAQGQKELDKIGNQKKSIKRLQELHGSLGRTASKLDLAKKKAAALGRELKTTTGPTRMLRKQHEAAVKSIAKLTAKHKQETAALRKERAELKAAGIDTRSLRKEQDRLGQSYVKTSKKMEASARLAAKVRQAEIKRDRALQRAANISLVAGGMSRVGGSMIRSVTDPVDRMRMVERSKGELKSLGMQDTKVVESKGRQLSKMYAGINTSDFISAAYDIKSGISTLSDKGVSEMTAAAAVTAKATKASVSQMTSLFATGYGSFKKSLYKDLTDEQFGEVYSASISKAVQQFKTDGGKMQQAIQGMGSGLAESKISLAQQFTALGMLQQKMEAGVAGTTMKAVERTAAVAQEKFKKEGISIKTLDENGNLRKLDVLLEDMQKVFGKEYTTETGATIQKAFGSEEAVAFFKALWGQQDAFRANTKAMEQAQAQGAKFTRAMAHAMDDNMDAKLQIQQQRWDVIKERLGSALIPVLEKLIPVIEKVAGFVEGLVSGHGNLATVMMSAVGAVGMLAVGLAPVLTAIASLNIALAQTSLLASKAALSTGLSNAAGGGGFFGGKGGGKGLWGRIKGMGKWGKIGLGGTLALGAMSLGTTLTDDNKTMGQKAAGVSEDLGGIGGALAGAAAGAAIGSIIPGAGTIVGGILGAAGSILGGLGGGWLGRKFGSLFTDDGDKKAPSKTATAVAMAGAGGSIKPSVEHTDNSQYRYDITVNAAPGMNETGLAKQVAGELEKRDRRIAKDKSSRMYDELYD